MYWTISAFRSSGQVRRANKDGSGAVTLADAPDPHDIVVDSDDVTLLALMPI